ncbi:MAG: tetratricopeptide repeat protein, partial [Treponema sp.]|nr:tetratricopeptide repeat protein [Treponema sp.]
MEKSDLETAAEFDKNGDHEQALVYYMKALDERKATLGEKHPDVAALYTTIGRALNDQEDYDNAVSYYEKALEIRRAVYKAYYPQTAAVCETIGSILEDTGECDGALAYYENALDASERAYGKYHPCLIALHEKIEKILTAKGDEENARAHHERAHKLEMIRRGLDVPDKVRDQILLDDDEQAAPLHEIKENDVSYLQYNNCKIELTEKITIGRDSDNNMVVDDKFVSRHHCIIQ